MNNARANTLVYNDDKFCIERSGKCITIWEKVYDGTFKKFNILHRYNSHLNVDLW